MVFASLEEGKHMRFLIPIAAAPANSWCKHLFTKIDIYPLWNNHSGRRKVLFVKKNAIVTPLALMVVALAAGQDTVPHSSGGISGLVRYPDGTPSAGATVSAVTECKYEVHVNFVQDAKTSADGSFYVPPFLVSGCNHIRLSAKKVEELWLKTGRDVFYEKDNGTTPVLEAPRSGSPTTTEIKLGNRGALVSFRVRDAATDRFIWAGLYLKRMPVPGAKFGSMMIATGRDGSPDTLLFPAGHYEVSVERYSCSGTDYFTNSPPREILTVEAGQRIAKDISVDVRLIKPMSSYNNPEGKPCKP